MSTRPSPEVRAQFSDLYADYFWALDTHDVERYANTFWGDGVLEEVQLDGSVLTTTGREDIGGFARQAWFGHVGYQHRDANRLYLPDPDGRDDRWVVRAYWFTSRREGTEVEFLSTGHSTDVIELRNSAEWRFALRRIERWPTTQAHPLAS